MSGHLPWTTAACLRSRRCQLAAVAVSVLFVGALHVRNDGLWYQGDAPRHAMNGLFYWDLLRTLPADPVDFAVRYYARYPVINPAAYPPLFYVFEGLTYAVFGASPYAAKCLVLLFAAMAGCYTLAWARRWIGPPAGWAGAFLAFVPAVVLWSNAVMLNVPAMALALAALYHFRRWLESSRGMQLALAGILLASVMLTYYQALTALPVFAGWSLMASHRIRIDRRAWRIAGVVLCALLPVAASLLLAPVNASRHLPSLAFLAGGGSLPFYWKVLARAMGSVLLTLGAVSLVAALSTRRWRREALFVATWMLSLTIGLSLLPAKDQRYVLLLAPAFVLAVTLGAACAAEYVARWTPAVHALALSTLLILGAWSAGHVRVPEVTGFREIATYLREHAPNDAVLYDGHYDGLFGFYVRALDPQFERRIARGDRLLYEYGPASTFEWVQKSNVTSTDEAVAVLTTRSGCRWIAIERRQRPDSVLGRQLLRDAIARPEFELVRSFRIEGAGVPEVDLYRVVNGVPPVASVDLTFPSFSERPFSNVVPITR